MKTNFDTNEVYRNLLGVKDKNIIFEFGSEVREKIDGVWTQIVDAKLLGNVAFEECCEERHIHKNGFLKTHVLLPKPSSRDKTILRLYKQRHRCKNCNKSSVVSTPLVNKSCTISNPLKLHIFHDACKKRSEVCIGYDNAVSNTSVSRIIDEIYEKRGIDFDKLPKVMCFDELKSTKDAEGAMSFIYADADTGKIMDILESRTLEFLRIYFSRFTVEAREGVEKIVIDMYSPYMTLINDLFPKAEIITDKFHIVQLISRALNKTRVKIMNFKEQKKNYKKLKKYWKLLLKYKDDVNSKKYRYCPCFRRKMTHKGIIEYLLTTDDELRETYELYQDLLHAVRTKDAEKFEKVLTEAFDEKGKPIEGISNYMKTSVETLRGYLPSVLAALNTKYTNGLIEGLITQIKLIKRIAFGYRNFVHFKARILMIHDYNPVKLEKLRKKKRKAEEQAAEIALLEFRRSA